MGRRGPTCAHPRWGGAQSPKPSLAIQAPTCQPAGANSTPRRSLFAGAGRKSSEGAAAPRTTQTLREPDPLPSFLVAPPIPPPPSHVVIHAFFLRIPDRRSPPAIIYTVNKSPRRVIFTYRSWRAPGRAGSIGRETGDG